MTEPPLEIRSLETARTVRRLSTGPVAESWLIEHKNRRLVLRRDLPCASLLGLDRERELQVLREAHGRGLAPRCLLADPVAGILVTEYVAGESWQDQLQDQSQEQGEAHVWKQLGALLGRVHSLESVSVPRFDPGETFKAYARAADSPQAHTLARDLKVRANSLYGNAPWALCHHDPHLGNVIGRPGTLIDWEYAALGHPLFDLASVIEYQGLEEEAISAVLAGWLETLDSRFSGKNCLRELDAFRSLVAGVNRLWNLAVQGCV